MFIERKSYFHLINLVAIHQISASSSSSKHRINKRYYDSWNSNNDVSSSGYDEPIRIYPFRQKSYKKEDPCANKPLWYLKYQSRLGRLSPFYDCLSVHGI